MMRHWRSTALLTLVPISECEGVLSANRNIVCYQQKKAFDTPAPMQEEGKLYYSLGPHMH